MRLDLSFRLHAIVLTCGLVASGCAKLSWNRETPGVAPRADASTEEHWGRANRAASSPGSESFFFNDKSREIERSLGL